MKVSSCVQKFHSLLRPGLSLVHEASLRGFMRQGPADVHLDIDDLRIPNGEDLGVSKSMTLRIASFVRDEHAIGIGDEIDEVESQDGLADWPAATEVRLAVDPIVEGAREMKIAGKERLEGLPVLCYVGVILRRRIEIAINYGYNLQDESQCGGSQKYAAQVNQGGGKRRVRDDLPARHARGGHRPDNQGRSREAEVRNVEGQGDGSRPRLVEADDQR